MNKDWTVAFAGDADLDERNLSALLDDWLPTDSEVATLIPERIGRSQKGLKKVLTWLESQDIIASRFEAGQDPIKELIKAREDGQDAYLVLLWGEHGGDDRSRDLFDRAFEAGIPVKDLAGALDDLKYEDEEPPAQPQPEPEQPKRRRRGTAAGQAQDKPAASRTAPPQAEADEAQALIPPQMATPAKAVLVDEATAAYAEGMKTATLDGVLRRIIRDMLTEELGRLGLNGLSNIHQAEEMAKPDEPTSDYLMSADGRYRPKTTRTRAKKDETEVRLTTAEAEELREAGLLS